MKALESLVAKAGLVVASVAVSLLVFEGTLRLIGYRYSPLRIETINAWSEWRYYHAFDNAKFVYDPELIWRPRKGSGVFNEQGFRGKLLTPSKDVGTVRIFAIGDSNTLGWLGDGAPQWPIYLEQILNQDGYKTTVINAGVYGYTSFQGLRRFKEILPFEPDMVLISFGCNDAMRVTMSDAEFAGRKIRQDDWYKTLMQARVGQLILSILEGFSGSKTKTSSPEWPSKIINPICTKSFVWAGRGM